MPTIRKISTRSLTKAILSARAKHIRTLLGALTLRDLPIPVLGPNGPESIDSAIARYRENIGRCERHLSRIGA